jgi:purine nucleoside permease
MCQMCGTIQSEGRHALLETMRPEQRTRSGSASALLHPADSRTGPRAASLTSCSLPWTGGRGTFAMTAEKDAGIMQSLTFLAHARRVDLQRVLVLRTASDFSAPGDGEDAAGLLARDAAPNGESAYREALEAAYRVGSRVVNELSAHWNRYGERLPVAP